MTKVIVAGKYCGYDEFYRRMKMRGEGEYRYKEYQASVDDLKSKRQNQPL